MLMHNAYRFFNKEIIHISLRPVCAIRSRSSDRRDQHRTTPKPSGGSYIRMSPRIRALCVCMCLADARVMYCPDWALLAHAGPDENDEDASIHPTKKLSDSFGDAAKSYFQNCRSYVFDAERVYLKNTIYLFYICGRRGIIYIFRESAPWGKGKGNARGEFEQVVRFLWVNA